MSEFDIFCTVQCIQGFLQKFSKLVQFKSGGLNFFESSCMYGRIFVKSVQTRPRIDLNLFKVWNFVSYAVANASLVCYTMIGDDPWYSLLELCSNTVSIPHHYCSAVATIFSNCHNGVCTTIHSLFHCNERDMHFSFLVQVMGINNCLFHNSDIGCLINHQCKNRRSLQLLKYLLPLTTEPRMMTASWINLLDV